MEKGIIMRKEDVRVGVRIPTSVLVIMHTIAIVVGSVIGQLIANSLFR